MVAKEADIETNLAVNIRRYSRGAFAVHLATRNCRMYCNIALAALECQRQRKLLASY